MKCGIISINSTAIYFHNYQIHVNNIAFKYISINMFILYFICYIICKIHYNAIITGTKN